MSVFLVPIAALCIPMVIVPVALGLRHARAVREMTHAERLRALELGVDLRPTPGLSWPGAALCIALGVVLPLGTFALCTLAVVVGADDGASFVLAMLVSGVAIWTARNLAYRLLAASSAELTQGGAPTLGPKPTNYDPDAFDVVGSRG